MAEWQDVLENSRQWTVVCSDSLSAMKAMPDGCVHCAVTSPPYYGLRRYLPAGHPDVAKELGSEKTPDCLGWATGKRCGTCYVCHLTAVFEGVRRVLRDDGTLWLNLGDSYSRGNGSKNGQQKTGRKQLTNRGAMVQARPGAIPEGFKDKDLLGIPWRVAFALQADGWHLRADCIWTKLSAMPSSVKGWRWERCRVKVKAQNNPEEAGLYAAGSGNRRCRDGSGGVTGKMPAEYQTEWEDCPGCKKCLPHGGYVLRKGSWRPTTAHEYIFLFSKTEKYYADGYAVRQRLAESTIIRDRYTRVLDDPDEQFAVAHDHESISDPDIGANLRSWLVFKSEGFKGNHYAVFPPELPSLAVKCGTSEAGVCPRCGAPHARVVHTKPMVVDEGPKNNGYRESSEGSLSRTACSGTMTERPEAKTLGWRASCACGVGDAIPAVVLDPFGGAGTSLLAARRLGRRAIGLELNEEYAEAARRRLLDDNPLFNATLED